MLLPNYLIELGDFLEADNFHQVVIKMEASSKCRESFPSCAKQLQNPSVSDYKIEMLNPSVKEEVKRFATLKYSYTLNQINYDGIVSNV